MLATFVIGLREGLEAALIVGIIAAFLKRSNRTDALRKVWLGVAAAVLLCLAVGIGLQLVNAALPQREQEMLECVIAAIAVLTISYMVLWMRAHSRDLRKDLQSAAGNALARGSAGALVVMAFLAVIREGFETAVFLLAAFQSALSPLEAGIGVVLGVGVAVALGYLVYRGGVQLNLSRFFRITGVVLVLVAAGLVMSTLRAAYEAGWVTVGQQTALDLSAIARPGSVQESLLTGVLGIRSSLPVVEVVAYLLYAVPMLLVVLWPAKRTPPRPALGRILVGTAAGSLVLAGLLVAAAPGSPGQLTSAQGPFALQSSNVSGIDPWTGQPLDGTTIAGSAQLTLASAATSADLSAELGGSTITGSSALAAIGHVDVADAGAAVSATVLAGSPITAPVDPTALGLPSTMTGGQIANLNGGRLPVGVRSQPDAFVVGYTDTVTPTVKVDTATGVILGLDLRLVRTLVVTVPDRGSVSAGTVLESTSSATPGSVAAGVAQVAEVGEQRVTHQVVGQVIPGLLVVFALVLLAFGLPKLFGNQRPPPVAGASAPADGRDGGGPPQGPDGPTATTPLAKAGHTRPSAH